MRILSEIDKQGCEEVETKRGNHKNGCEDEPGLDDPVWQRTRASLAVSAGKLRRSIDQPITVAEAGYRRRDEAGLIGCKPRKIADPRSAHAEAKQD